MALTPEQQALADKLVSGKLKLRSPECFCMQCDVEENGMRSRMSLCPDCVNKRCPKATHHNNKCSGINEPGQEGSAYR